MADSIADRPGFRRIVGASLSSAAGSLPTNLLPLTITAVVAGTTVTAETAGLIAPAMLIGQLISSFSLPLLGVTSIGRLAAAATSVAMLAGLALSGADGTVGVLAGWFIVGLCCGVLLFLGTVAAARYATPALAFALRLGVVLVLAGVCAALVQVTDAAASYTTYLICLAAAFAVILAIGNALYAPIPPPPRADHADDRQRSLLKMVSGLTAAYVLFVGQTGLMAYVLLLAVGRGITLHDAAWIFAAVKVGSGIWLIVASRVSRPGSSVFRMAFLGLLVAVGGFVMSTTRDVQHLFAFLILFQIAFNSLSAQVQGTLAATGPGGGGRWITCTLLLAAASGPPLHGWAIGAGLEQVFIIFAVSSCVLPATWLAFCRWGRRRDG